MSMDRSLRRRRRMRRALVVLGCACLVGSTMASPANIDDGFLQDGKTTYCRGIQQDAGPLVFESLDTSSAGKCPIDVKITTASTSVAPATPLTVKWTASAHQGTLATNLFPGAIDSTTQKPLDVIASLLRACKTGSNCATPESIVEPAVFTNDTSTDTGAFDSTGTKTLKSYQFQFPKSGDEYVIIAKVQLPGDPKLNVSAQEFIAFQHITVGTTVTKVPATGGGTVRAADADEVVSDADAGKLTQSGTTTTATTNPAAEDRSADVPTPSVAGGQTTSSTRSGQGSSMKTISIIGVAGVVMVLAVVGYALMGVHEKRKLEAFARRQTRTFSMSMAELDTDPEPMAPMRRIPSHGSSRPSTHASSRISQLSSHGPPPQPPTRASRKSRLSGPKISGADVFHPNSRPSSRPSSRPGSRPNSRPSSVASGYAGLSDNGRLTTKDLVGPDRPSQYGWSRSSLAPHEIMRPSQKHRPSRPSSYDRPSVIQRASKPSRPSTSSVPYVIRTSRAHSTSSTKSEDFSSEESIFSISNGTTRGNAPSYENAAIMESAEMMAATNRRSSVALLELGSSRASDASSLGSLHDAENDLVPYITVPRTSSIDEEPVPVPVALPTNSFYRPSSNVFANTTSTFSHSGLSIRSSQDGGENFYARDTHEYAAPFAERDSESEWMDYQL